MILRKSFLFFFIMFTFTSLAYAENLNQGKEMQYVEDVFTGPGNHTITTNGKILGTFQSSDPALAGKLVILQMNDSSDKSTISTAELWVIIGTFLAFGGTSAGVIMSDYRTRNDQNARIRPIISRGIGSTDKGPCVVYDDHFSLKITNHGSLPAIKIKKHYKLEIKQNGKVTKQHPDPKNGKTYVETEASPCSVGESYYTRFFCPTEFIDAIKNTNDCYFEINLMYYYSPKKEFIYKLPGHFEKGEMIYGEIKIT